jgi:hypothetical protein
MDYKNYPSFIDNERRAKSWNAKTLHEQLAFRLGLLKIVYMLQRAKIIHAR